jgi:hypothetical protein
VRVWRGPSFPFPPNPLPGCDSNSWSTRTDGECLQTITHPAISVWTVSSLPNGDIVSGCSDHVVRVFSVEEGRWLPEADLKIYDEQVANHALPSQQIGDVKKSDLPGLEALNVPGDCLSFCPKSAAVANERDRQKARRDKDGQEWGCCRGTSGRDCNLPSHRARLTQYTVGRRFEPVDQSWNRRRCCWVREEATLSRQGVRLRV